MKISLDPDAEEFVPSNSEHGSDGVVNGISNKDNNVNVPGGGYDSFGTRSEDDELEDYHLDISNFEEMYRLTLSGNAKEFVPSTAYSKSGIESGNFKDSDIVHSDMRSIAELNPSIYNPLLRTSTNTTGSTPITLGGSIDHPRVMGASTIDTRFLASSPRRVLPTWLSWPSPTVLDRQYLNQALNGGCLRKHNGNSETLMDSLVAAQPDTLRAIIAEPLLNWGKWRSTPESMESDCESGVHSDKTRLKLKELITDHCKQCQHDVSDNHEPKLLHNESNVPGYVNGTGLDFILPVVQLFFFVEPVRRGILRHAHDGRCELLSCLICEIGFVYFMMISIMRTTDYTSPIVDGAYDANALRTNNNVQCQRSIERHDLHAKGFHPLDFGGPFPVGLHHVARSLREISTVSNLGLMPGSGQRHPNGRSNVVKSFCSRTLIFTQLLLDTLQSNCDVNCKGDIEKNITCSKTTSVYCGVEGCPALDRSSVNHPLSPEVVAISRPITTTNSTLSVSNTNASKTEDINNNVNRSKEGGSTPTQDAQGNKFGTHTTSAAASTSSELNDVPSSLVYVRVQPTFIVELKAFRRENGNGDTEVIGHRFAACLQAALFNEVTTTAPTTTGAQCKSCLQVGGQRTTQRLVHRLSNYLLINCYTDLDYGQTWRTSLTSPSINNNLLNNFDNYPPGGGVPLKLGISLSPCSARVFSLTATPSGMYVGLKQGRGCLANEELWRSITRPTANTYSDNPMNKSADSMQHYEYELVAMICNVNPDMMVWSSSERTSASFGNDSFSPPDEGYPIILMKTIPNQDKDGQTNNDEDGSPHNFLKAAWEAKSAYGSTQNISISDWMKYVMGYGDSFPLTVLLCVYRRTPMTNRSNVSKHVPVITNPTMIGGDSRNPFKGTVGSSVRILARPKPSIVTIGSGNSISGTGGHVAGLNSKKKNSTGETVASLDLPDIGDLYERYRTKTMPKNDSHEWILSLNRSMDCSNPISSFAPLNHFTPLTAEEEQDIISRKKPFIVGLDAEFVKITVPTSADVYSSLMRKQDLPSIIDTLNPIDVGGHSRGTHTIPTGDNNHEHRGSEIQRSNVPVVDASNLQIPKTYNRPVPFGKMVILSLARVSVVRYYGNMFGRPIFDCYVQHSEEPYDCLTCYSGIHNSDLLVKTSNKPNLVSFKTLYRKLRFLVDNGVTIVGHGLQKDFRIINIHVPHYQTIDTVHLFRLPNQRLISLRYLLWLFFGLHIQEETHDSVEDAVAALKLFKLYGAMANDPDIRIGQIVASVYAIGYKTKWKVPNEQDNARAFYDQNSMRTFPPVQGLVSDEMDNSNPGVDGVLETTKIEEVDSKIPAHLQSYSQRAALIPVFRPSNTNGILMNNTNVVYYSQYGNSSGSSTGDTGPTNVIDDTVLQRQGLPPLSISNNNNNTCIMQCNTGKAVTILPPITQLVKDRQLLQTHPAKGQQLNQIIDGICSSTNAVTIVQPQTVPLGEDNIRNDNSSNNNKYEWPSVEEVIGGRGKGFEGIEGEDGRSDWVRIAQRNRAADVTNIKESNVKNWKIT